MELLTTQIFQFFLVKMFSIECQKLMQYREPVFSVSVIVGVFNGEKSSMNTILVVI